MQGKCIIIFGFPAGKSSEPTEKKTTYAEACD